MIGPRDYRFLLDGELVEPAEPVEVRSPYTGDLVGRAGQVSSLEIERALAGGAAARGPMAALAAWQRSQALHELEKALRLNRDEFAALICAESAKPIRDANVEVDRALLTVRTAAEEALRIGGEQQPLDFLPGSDGRFAVERRVPRGLILAVTPFNFPLNLVLHKLAPALAAGNSIVVKASPRTPLTALRLGELVAGCELPPGAVNVVSGGAEAVAALLADDRVAMLSFTGSAAVGWQLKAAAGRKHVTLELGGNAANIVHNDADLDYACRRLAAGAFSFAGQSCISVQRVLVQRGVYSAVRDRLAAAAAALRIGDPADPATELGPMITPEAAARSAAWIHEALQQGARLVTGGTCDGGFLTPTILENVRPEMDVCREEVFAPLLVLIPYDTPAEALALANASRYGLQAALFTNDLNFVLQAFDKLEVGAIIVNDVSGWRMDPMPYGGVKQSGYGREGIRSSIAEMTELRLVVFRPPRAR